MTAPITELEIQAGRRRVIVRRNDGHPEQYLFADLVNGAVTQRYFLGVLVNGMTRRDVRRMVRELLARHPG